MSNPMVLSVQISCLCGTESKALVRSENTAPIVWPRSIPSSQSCTADSRVCVVDLPGRKPHWLSASGYVESRKVVILR